MYHRDEGFLSATAEWLGIHVDLRARRPAEIPKASLKRLVELKRDHAKIPIPPQIGRNIGIRK